MKTKQLLILAVLAGVAHAAPAPLVSGIPAFLDTNGDGIVSEAERLAFAEARKDARDGLIPDWDTNGDGTIDEEEEAAAVATLQSRANEMRAKLFAKVANENGVLTIEEFSALPPFAKIEDQSIVTALFELLDADGNGEITAEEFLARLNAGIAPPTSPPTPPTPPAP